MPTPPPPRKDDTEASNHSNKSTTPPSPSSHSEGSKPNSIMGVQVVMGIGHEWCHGENNTGDRPTSSDANLPAQVQILPRPRICHHVVASGSEQRNNDTSAPMTKVPVAHKAPGSPQAGPTQPHSSTSSSSSATLGQPPVPLSPQSVQASIQAAVSLTASSPKKKIKTKTTPKRRRSSSSSNSSMSVDRLMPSGDEIKSPPPKRRKQNKQAGESAGRWTRDEHQAFLAGLKEFGREWKKVATRIPTRTSAQIRSHAQKYFSKIERDQEAMVLPEGAVPVVEIGRMTPSVQRNIDRLLSDPHAAQREVETTMGALQERYRQLQLRLARRQQRTTTSPTADAKARMVVENYGHSRKRAYSQIMEGHADDLSSVSSNISASVASLGNEELIALCVLVSGALPRGDNRSSTEGAQEEVKSDRSTASNEQEGGGEGHQKDSSETN